MMVAWNFTAVKLALICIIVMSFLFFPVQPVSAESTDYGESSRSVSDGLSGNGTDEADESPAVLNSGDPAEELPVSQGEQSYIGLLFQMFLALAFIIALIYGLLKLFNKRNQTFQSHSVISSVGGVNLGPNRSVQLIKVGDKLLVVGVGENIQLLKEVTDPEEVEKMLEEHRPQDAYDIPLNKAGRWLKETVSSGRKKPTSFSSLLEDNLKEVRSSQTNLHAKLKEKE
ncbi:flagellar biosynthetic protein FliO [Bacillus sp. H-16]|uniref:flagellar biosynthetic protein FliO n=1 Tax=Alteribacter salitolerans TaxID=2912333 RepID=UPI00196455B5|nr:flagellar biosynthetic protein FliO [Alteribacter salitolerans]MBM7094185.1 flagellar biosynthetic protein FliO [Alteribacter salitolerans]